MALTYCELVGELHKLYHRLVEAGIRKKLKKKSPMTDTTITHYHVGDIVALVFEGDPIKAQVIRVIYEVTPSTTATAQLPVKDLRYDLRILGSETLLSSVKHHQIYAGRSALMEAIGRQLDRAGGHVPCTYDARLEQEERHKAYVLAVTSFFSTYSWYHSTGTVEKQVVVYTGRKIHVNSWNAALSNFRRRFSQFGKYPSWEYIGNVKPAN